MLFGLWGPWPQIGGWFGDEVSCKVIYFIWFMCVWTMIVVAIDMEGMTTIKNVYLLPS